MRTPSNSCGYSVILVNSDVIDKLGFGVLPSVPFRPPLFGALRLRFRLLPEPCGAAAGNPGAPSPTRCSAALRQASETHPGGSIAVGLALRRLERLALRCLPRPSLHRHRLAPPRLSPSKEHPGSV